MTVRDWREGGQCWHRIEAITVCLVGEGEAKENTEEHFHAARSGDMVACVFPSTSDA